MSRLLPAPANRPSYRQGRQAGRQDRQGFLGVFAWRPWRFSKLFQPLESKLRHHPPRSDGSPRRGHTAGRVTTHAVRCSKTARRRHLANEGGRSAAAHGGAAPEGVKALYAQTEAAGRLARRGQIPREGDDAVIDYQDPDIATTHFRLGPSLCRMTDRQILDRFNKVVAAERKRRRPYHTSPSRSRTAVRRSATSLRPTSGCRAAACCAASSTTAVPTAKRSSTSTISR